MPRNRFAAQESVIAAACEAMRRHLRVPATGAPLDPYPEQVAAARALLRGSVVEMATGEGKTVVAALAAACWAGQGPVHVATANAYLAERDAAWLRPVYQALGLSVGVVTPTQGRDARRQAYACDVVYSTLAEFGFDYLRDRLVLRPADRVQVRGLGALIVDEADLLLIDEARTPLVIAEPAPLDGGPDLPALARVIAALVQEQDGRVRVKLALLERGGLRRFDAAVLAAQVRRGAPRHLAVLDYFARHPAALHAAEQVERELQGAHAWMLDDGLLYSVDERARTAAFTAEGQAALEARLGPLFERPAETAETLAALHSLLLAYALFHRDRDYLVREGRVVLIEEATGRAAESRRYLHGLHAAIETKELGWPQEAATTLAQISVQQFVRQYARRAGMTGTAAPAADEFLRVYDMPLVTIPRHRPNRRVDLPTRLYRTQAEVDTAVVEEVVQAWRLGRPLLVGTHDVARSERLSALLRARGVPHVVLNAREHAREAQIVAGAGRFGAVTIATTMAGRGTDIRLEAGLEGRLTARAAAQIAALAHNATVTVTCDSPRALTVLRDALLGGATAREGSSLTLSVHGQSLVVRRAGPAAGSRTVSLRFGLGLYVLAVEPGADRRLDDQLRGRSGRQGDEGSTRLYASLECETLRFYGAAHVRARALRALAYRPFVEGRAAEAVVRDAQERARRLHEGQRWRLFEYDQVLEAQRRAMLAGYERALQHTAPDVVVRDFIPAVARGEVVRRPSDAAAAARWAAEVAARYGLPAQAPADVDALAAALAERWHRVSAEAGAAWPALARAALLRAAAELWAEHVERTEHLQQQAPALFAFLPGPAAVPYAKEASYRYEEYVWHVQAETLATLLTLPMPYERPLAPGEVELSGAAAELLHWLERGTAHSAGRSGMHNEGESSRRAARTERVGRRVGP